ncbi:MAG: 6-phospho-beta-glucosidase [Patescibacteria group bacterium]
MAKGLKIAIIGAGSSYTPELIEELARRQGDLPVREIALMDIDEERLGIVHGFCRRFARHLGYKVELTATVDRRAAIEGADFVDTQIRVGGNAARVNDEKIPLKYGLIGQETTGAGGFAKALRTIPAMLEIARDVERFCPQAWIVNYTNPTGLVTEAVTKYTKARIAGLCSGWLGPKVSAAEVLGVPPASVRYDYAGLNHMNFAFNLTIDGRPLTSEEFDRLAAANRAVDAELIKKLRALPSGYLHYYYHTSKKVVELRSAPKTRGEVVRELEKEVFAAYADPGQETKPAALSKRGGGGYSEVAIGLMDAVHNDRDRWMVVNTPNRGAIRMLPDDAVVEIGCLVDRAGIHPLALAAVPQAVWGLIAAVKNYEQLAVEAAVKGDRDLALLALVAHPLVRDYDLARPLLAEILETNRDFLPQFS